MLRADSTARALRRALALAAFAALAACSSPADRGANAPSGADRASLVDAHAALLEAWGHGDAAAFAALVEPSKRALVFHPRVENRFEGIDEIRDGLGRMFAKIGPATIQEFHPYVDLDGDVGWVTYHVLVEAENLDAPFVGRGTEIWVHGDGGWKLVHAHWSENPEVEPET